MKFILSNFFHVISHRWYIPKDMN